MSHQAGDFLLRVASAPLQLLVIGGVRTFSEPSVGNRPAPSGFPGGQSVVPDRVLNGSGNSVGQARHRLGEDGLGFRPIFLVAKQSLDGDKFPVALAVGADVSLFYGVGECFDYRMNVMQTAKFQQRFGGGIDHLNSLPVTILSRSCLDQLKPLPRLATQPVRRRDRWGCCRHDSGEFVAGIRVVMPFLQCGQLFPRHSQSLPQVARKRFSAYPVPSLAQVFQGELDTQKIGDRL